MEDFFDKATLSTKLAGKTFNPEDDRDNTKEYSKKYFADKVVYPRRNKIAFGKFKPILSRITECIDHYESIK